MSEFTRANRTDQDPEVARGPVIEPLTGYRARKTFSVKKAIIALSAIALAYYLAQWGLSYREVIVAFATLILGIVVFNGERGIQFGFVLWVLTLSLGYRTIALTRDLYIHPSEVLLWVLLVCICVHRQLLSTSRLSFPVWVWLLLPFWVLASWPLALRNARLDAMLNEIPS